MPNLDGYELLKLIKSTDKFKHIPVIMMSAENENNLVAACILAGAKTYLVKPILIH